MEITDFNGAVGLPEMSGFSLFDPRIKELDGACRFDKDYQESFKTFLFRLGYTPTKGKAWWLIV